MHSEKKVDTSFLAICCRLSDVTNHTRALDFSDRSISTWHQWLLWVRGECTLQHSQSIHCQSLKNGSFVFSSLRCITSMINAYFLLSSRKTSFGWAMTYRLTYKILRIFRCTSVSLPKYNLHKSNLMLFISSTKLRNVPWIKLYLNSSTTRKSAWIHFIWR